MPFKSLAQEGYMHEHPEILGKTAMKEWDSATKGKSLPKKVGRQSHYRSAYTARKKEKTDGQAQE